MQWFLELLEELGIECRVGHPAKIRAKETRKQKHDRRDARLILELLIEERFPEIWMPSTEERDLRTLLRGEQFAKSRVKLFGFAGKPRIAPRIDWERIYRPVFLSVVHLFAMAYKMSIGSGLGTDAFRPDRSSVSARQDPGKGGEAIYAS